MPKVIMTRYYYGFEIGEVFNAFDGDDALDCAKANYWLRRKEGTQEYDLEGMPQYYWISKDYCEEV